MRQSELLKKYACLTDTQKERLQRKIDDYIDMNHQLKDTKPCECPHCRKETKMIKRGFANSKQRYECKECNKVFTYDSHTITSCLKIVDEEFIQICIDTLNLIPIAETVAKLNTTIQTVFNNRHKFLRLLEQILEKQPQILSGTIEIDETYELESSKGTTPNNRKTRKRGGRSKYRGISHEQTCIITAISSSFLC